MKCAILYKSGDLRIEERPIPQPNDREILIQVDACGICGTDLLIYDRKFPVDFPYSPGHEYVGRIVRLGKFVKHFSKGDRVVVNPNYSCGLCYYCKRGKVHLCENQKKKVKSNGGFAEYVVVPEKLVYKIPKSLTNKNAILVEPLSCCVHCINEIDINSTDTIAILGGGTIGLLMLQLVRKLSTNKIFLTEPNANKRRIAKEFGADIVINPLNTDTGKIINNNTNGYGVDVAIECTGKKEVIEESLRLINRSGIVVLTGLSGKNEMINISPLRIVKDELTIKGAFLNPFTYEKAIDLLAKKKIITKSLISDEFLLKDLNRAIELCKKGYTIKTIINC
ncbi:MAG: zinc-dependent alcohol dehydrogenase family protein [Candidatus Firestonebacteria bacterium]